MMGAFMFCGMAIRAADDDLRAKIRKNGTRIHTSDGGTHMVSYYDRNANVILIDTCLSVVAPNLDP